MNTTEKKGTRKNMESRVYTYLSSQWEGDIEEGRKTELCSEAKKKTMSKLQIVHEEQA